MSLEAPAVMTPRSWSRPPVAQVLEHASVTAAFITLAYLTHQTGGRDPHDMVRAIWICLPALVLTRPWRRLPTGLLALLAVLPISALAVSYLTPMQFAYSRDLSVWAYVAVLGTAVAAYVQQAPSRRLAVAVAVCVLGFYEFFQAFVPWRYKQDPGMAMKGTFYQQDMYGAFCAATALAAAAVAVLGARVWRMVGWLVAPVCIVGVILSTSRAAEGLLGLGLLVLGLLAALSPTRWKSLAAFAGLLALSAGLLLVITGPLFFPHRLSSPLEGTTRRAGSDSLDSSWTIRRAYWHAAVRQFADAPLVGEGFGSIGVTFFERAPLGAFGSRYAHNGFLQGLGEGGLLFGLPLCALGLYGGVLALRALPRTRADALTFSIAAGAGLGALALLGHTLVDFDWSFPALAGLLVVLVAVAARPLAEARERSWVRVSLTVLITAAVLMVTYVVRDYHDPVSAALPRPGAVHRAEAAADSWRPNPVLWVSVLNEALVSGRTDVGERDARRALARTRALGRLDPNVQLLRARVLVHFGDEGEGLRLARDVVTRTQNSRPDLLAVYAELLAQTGDRTQAVHLLAVGVEQRAKPGFPLPDNVWRLVQTLQSLTSVEAPQAVCAFDRAEHAFGVTSRPAVVPVPRDRRCRSA